MEESKNKEFDIEMKCPRCNYDMKELLQEYKCGNLDCRLIVKKKFSHNPSDYKHYKCKCGGYWIGELECSSCGKTKKNINSWKD